MTLAAEPPRLRISEPWRVFFMYPKVDATDWQLIRLLQANARESTATLARKLNLARTTVVSRLGRLEREGVIAGYGVRLGASVEAGAVRAYCSISVLPRSAAQVIKALASMPEVEEVSAVSGAFDYLAFICCERHEQLDELLDRIGAIDGVKQTQTSIILTRKIDRRSEPSR
ncbi:DNA-binding transcriptional regulator, Lrp family [Pseudomonas lutea]|uniref:DNA-binding transcriptional regulator, Lrp family n=2 Tax=Pseudomonas TaxID=286 RepID=A0A9X8MEA0_9PSED|nr:DNA-binding transcriptional regulator, Lrp family [Pseudomonas lutea]